MSELVSTSYEVDVVKKYYGGTVTISGRNLITSLIAGETIEFTRIVVGSGKMPDDVEPIDMKDLIHPIAEATSNVPTVENGVLSMIVEYRNDMNGGLKEGFWLSEFGIYARTEKTEEVLLYYATLGNSPQPVSAYKDGRVDVRRYPISIALELDANVQVSYNPGAFITSEDAELIISDMVKNAMARIGSTIIKELVIPTTGWRNTEIVDEMDEDFAIDYPYCLDIPVSEATEEQSMNLNPHKNSLRTAEDAGFCPVGQVLDGIVRIWSNREPERPIECTLTLLSPHEADIIDVGYRVFMPTASNTRLGAVKVGPGLNVGLDGTLSVDTASEEEVEKLLTGVLSPDDK